MLVAMIAWRCVLVHWYRSFHNPQAQELLDKKGLSIANQGLAVISRCLYDPQVKLKVFLSFE